ncbi:FAD-binding oxidoreductase [Pararhodobacter aggregans]|uniref:Hydroxyacid dehydrogenase n=1 Tax=Pararhodobacter aggregans TaxID=404875 RepID=A0A2T7UWE1_9RHOB|nr:FAD-binding oxidoreductase [Pararhodobacter aggregans]PTW99558.1 FAD/FMN-containing dehydrogenase [Pararhodobacter aggregans]PVE48886.1 hydroxyacid dehydrogenase [Pararhodobacter aggregans]
MLNPCDPAFLQALEAQLPPGVLRAPEDRYLTELRGRYRGQAGAVACPGSVEEVASILKAAQAARVGVVPYAGGTGLVAGQVMPEGPLPLVLSVERLNRIRSVEPLGNVLVAEAGCILTEVQAAAEGAERLFPMSLGSEGSARIGGLLGTNAGGTGVLRYGTMRELALGLEVVLADGRVIHGLKRLRKNNMGYDLRHLMIGSEGTLGVITAAALRLFPRPARTGAALIVVPSPEAALRLLALAQARLGEGVSGFELIGGQGLHFLAEALPQIRQPFAEPPEWLVLVDLGLVAALDPAAELEGLFEAAVEADLASDGVIAGSEAQRAAFWHLREAIPEANRKIGAVASHDVSLPLAALPAFIAEAGAALADLGDLRVNCFGHVGDGNLHYNIFPAPGRKRAEYDGLRDRVTQTVHDLVHGFGGSVSAEHGVGRLKTGDLERYVDPVAVSAMRSIKAALDPAGILNPGAVLKG